MRQKNRFSRPERIAAALLALIWIAASLVVMGLAIAARRWPVLLPAALGLGYGLLWARASSAGRRLPWPVGLLPRRRRPR